MRMRIGDKIDFGDYEWRVLATESGRALMMTEAIIQQRPYHDAYREITWADCSLRKYLNGEFYNSFSEADRAQIVTATNHSRVNYNDTIKPQPGYIPPEEYEDGVPPFIYFDGNGKPRISVPGLAQVFAEDHPYKVVTGTGDPRIYLYQSGAYPNTTKYLW